MYQIQNVYILASPIRETREAQWESKDEITSNLFANFYLGVFDRTNWDSKGRKDGVRDDCDIVNTMLHLWETQLKLHFLLFLFSSSTHSTNYVQVYILYTEK